MSHASRAGLALAALFLVAAKAEGEDAPGVVVERVAGGSAAEKAGLRAGDRLLGWSQGETRGTLASPLDLARVELERGPRGAVHIQALRQGTRLEASLFPDDWGVEVSSEAEDLAPGVPGVEAHALHMQGRQHLEAERFAAAEAALGRAVDLYRVLDPAALAYAAALSDLALALDKQGKRVEEGRRTAAAAASLFERHAPRSLARARSLELQASYAANREEAQRLLLQALALKEELAPDSLVLAEVLERVATHTGDAQIGRRALALRERLAPESVGRAESLYRQAMRVADEGDATTAETMARRSVSMLERLRPGGLTLAKSLAMLGTILYIRGDLHGAETADRRSLAINETLTPGGINVARQLNNLAFLNKLQLDFAAAERHLERAVAILEKESPRGDLMARVYLNLGDVAHDRGELPRALGFYRQARERLVALDPGGYGISYVQEREGMVLVAQGQLDEAEARFMSALAMAEASYPRTGSAADKHHLLGDLALRQGRLDQAADRLHKALKLRTELAPGSLGEAETSHALGQVARRRGQRDEALSFFRRAVDALETQGRRLGGSPETRVRFRARYRALYRDLEDLLMEMGRAQEAFHVSERSRARGLLALLASRPLQLGASVPEALEKEKVQKDAEYDRILATLGSGALLAEDKRALLSTQLAAAREGQKDVRGRIRAAAPRAAALLDPEPLDLAGVQKALDPGTLLLAYSVGPTAARVFVVGPAQGELAVLPIDTDEARLLAEVRGFRTRIATSRGRLGQSALRRQARSLTQLLLAPAADPLRRAVRLLIVPDGPLHLLPFAALLDPAPRAGYLIESRPLHVISSVTLYSVLLSAPSGGGNLPVVAFGDPAYPPARLAAQAVPLRAALDDGLPLRPLPATRSEAESLRELEPTDAQVWLGPAASEERAKSLPARARVVHFACHGFLDADFPLESGLALAAPVTEKSGDNGFLQAWEVLEQVRTDADLVTLSACETGLGKDMAGEGLLGLTWAFQYAGARAVLASLWGVSDRSTAELMRHFYRALKAGASKAEALRRAQLSMLRRPGTAPPFFWAAFQLIGDGR
jgi:CHAT domain-containing protein/Tfp pilus assembly protein PilF